MSRAYNHVVFNVSQHRSGDYACKDCGLGDNSGRRVWRSNLSFNAILGEVGENRPEGRLRANKRMILASAPQAEALMQLMPSQRVFCIGV